MQPELDLVVNAPEDYGNIPKEPFGLKREFWDEILKCSSSTDDGAYTLMLYQDQLVDCSYKGFMDYFRRFAGLITDHFTLKETINYGVFYEYVKRALPLMLGSKSIARIFFLFFFNSKFYS